MERELAKIHSLSYLDMDQRTSPVSLRSDELPEEKGVLEELFRKLLQGVK